MFGGSRKDETFYAAFRDQAQLALDASRKFGIMLNDMASAEGAAADIAQDEKRADGVLRRTVRELHSTWITPLDRHHIHELVLALDGVLGLIDATATRAVIFAVREARGEAKELARNLSEACERIRRATDLLPKLSKPNAEEIIRLVSEVHEIEGHADEAHRRGLADLFDGRTDPLTVMKWREIFDNLAQATDLCQEVARLFEAIVLENA